MEGWERDKETGNAGRRADIMISASPRDAHLFFQTRDTLKGKQAMGTTSVDKSRRVGSVLAAEE
jgi:hypothetical protein